MKFLLVFILNTLYLPAILALALQAGLILYTATPCYADVKIEDYFEPAKNFPTLGSIFSTLLPNVFIIAGIILLFLLIFGGFSFIISAGKGESEGAGKGKNMITWAVVGFILIFAAYWIIEIISYITGIEFFKSKL